MDPFIYVYSHMDPLWTHSHTFIHIWTHYGPIHISVLMYLAWFWWYMGIRRRLHLRFCSRFGWIPICISAYTTWVLFRSFKMSTYLPQPSTPSVLDLIEPTPEDWEAPYRDYTEYRAFMLQCKHELIARGHAVWQTYSDQKMSVVIFKHMFCSWLLSTKYTQGM